VSYNTSAEITRHTCTLVRYIGNVRGAKWYISPQDIPYPFLGAVPHGRPQIRNFGPKLLTFDREYIENGKSERSCRLQLNITLRGLSKNVSYRAVAPLRKCTPIWRLCVLLTHLLLTNATLCLLSDIKSDILARVTPISVKFCMMVHIGPDIFFSHFGGGTPKRFPKYQILG